MKCGKEKTTMSHVEELQQQIENLTSDDFTKLREWFLKLEEERWDKQISKDYKSGKFDKLIDKARSELANGKATEL
jgi:ABC-type phosphate transport system auxiliary subunit